MRKMIMTVTAGLLASTSANAAPIVGLCNTGQNASCSGPGTLGAADANWFMSDPAGIAYNGNPIHPAWLVNDSTSLWVTPGPDGSTTYDAGLDGLYSYSITFDLTGFQTGSASFSGRFAVDNGVDTITLNGNAVTGSGGTFSSWSNFSSAGGFNSGLNTLTFNTRNFAQNGGNPAGLRVEFLQSNAIAVPEPATWALLILGFGLVGGAMRRRSAQAASARTTLRFA